MPLLGQLNLISQAKKYNLSLWQYPPFIFVIIGIIIIGAIFIAYFIGTKYLEPVALVLTILVITIILFIFDYVIVNSFERLAETNLMKSEFISILSHQLRTPITNIKWISDFAIKERDGSRKEEYFKNIQKQNERMSKLVNDMVSALQAEQGRWIFKKEEFQFETIIKEVLKKFELFVHTRNIKIEVDIEENLPRILADSQKISQVLSSLLDNAIRYTKEGKEVKIKALRKDKNIRCEIKDRGAGIPKEEQKYIFRKFFRSKNILKYQTEGMGLGLFITKGIINSMGGKMGFKSKEGIGSTFWFEIPIK